MKRFVVACLLAFVLTACGAEEMVSTFTGSGKVVFGTGTLEDGITEEKSVFEPYEDFMSEVDFASSLDHSEIDFRILEVSDNDLETLYDEWYVDVDPSWDYLLYEFQNVDYDGEFDPGDYIVRIYAGDSLVAEGGFSIRY